MKWGGVVPELAAREHVKAITPLIEASLNQAKLEFSDIDEIAVTTHPGLVGSLLAGINAAKTLSLFFEKPITPVNHLFAHLEAIHLTEKVSYPYLGLLVSGGHSVFFLVKNFDDMEVVGTTLDDAAGEAFDKGGKVLGVGYPAGKIIDELAKNGDRRKYHFPISYMKDRPGKMSFSGLKTSLRIQLQKMSKEEIELEKHHLCASYQEAIVQTLKVKTSEVIEKIISKKLPLVVGGGVACNSRLKEVLKSEFSECYFVAPEYCTDNAAMVANWASRAQTHRINFPDCLKIEAKSRYVEKK